MSTKTNTEFARIEKIRREATPAQVDTEIAKAAAEAALGRAVQGGKERYRAEHGLPDPEAEWLLAHPGF